MVQGFDSENAQAKMTVNPNTEWLEKEKETRTMYL